MRHCIIRLSCAALLSLAAAGGGLGMPTEPSGSWVYDYIDELRLSSDSLSFFRATLPYERCELAHVLSQCRIPEVRGGERMGYLLGLLDRELKYEGAWRRDRGNLFVGVVNSGIAARTRAKVGMDNLLKLNFYFMEGVALWTYMRLSVTYPEAHRIETRPWGNYFRASFDHGGIGYRGGRFSLFLGRDELAWGLQRHKGLLFSGAAPAMDMVKFAYLEDKVLFTSVHSRLRHGDADPWDVDVRRYVSAHRLDLKLWPRFTFAVSEVVLYGGEYRNFDPIYLNPVSVLYAKQWNSRSEDNILFSGDFTLVFPRAAEIRFEIVIDDFQYDFSSPHELGFGFDIAAKNPLLDLYSLFGLSYFHIRNGTYGHRIVHNRYTHESEVICYPFGPDGDFLEFRFSFSLPTETLWTMRLSQRRQGEGRVGDPQDEPPEDTEFPSGVVEKVMRAGLDVSWRPSYDWLIKGSLEWYGVSNEGNLEDSDRSDLRAAVGVGFIYSRDYTRD
jgi:hypothetical protein